MPRPQVAGLQRELSALKSSVTNAEVLRREVHHLNRELLAERSKVKALGEELESPLNVHRCGGRTNDGAACTRGDVCWRSVSAQHARVSTTSPLQNHRWRKLEGADPGAYEMVLKVQALQRRLIAKTEEVVEKDLLIQVCVGSYTGVGMEWQWRRRWRGAS